MALALSICLLVSASAQPSNPSGFSQSVKESKLQPIPNGLPSAPEPVTSPLPARTQGFVHLTGITPKFYVIKNAAELKAFVDSIPAVTPYKTLPAPPNQDLLRRGATVNFVRDVLVVAIGANRVSRHPEYQGFDEYDDGSRDVFFTLPAPTPEAFPFGWGVYTAIVLPRVSGPTTVLVETIPAEK